MVNKLRFSGSDIITDAIFNIEKTIEAEKRSNTQARDYSQQLTDLTKKLMTLEQLKSKGYLAVDVYLSQAGERDEEGGH